MAPKKAHRAEPDETQVALGEVTTALRSGRLVDAVDGLERAIRCAGGRRRALASLTSGVIGGVLYACGNTDELAPRQRALQWFRAAYPHVIRSPELAAEEPVPSAAAVDGATSSDTALPFDERVGTLGLRLMQRCGTSSNELLRSLRLMLGLLTTPPKTEGGSTAHGRVAPTRRLFTPLLEFCAQSGDVALAYGVLEEASNRTIDFRDVDLHHVALSATVRSVTDAAEAASYAAAAVRLASTHKPMIGGPSAELLQKLLPNSVVVAGRAPPTIGTCPNCGGSFGPYRFAAEERQRLLHDLVHVLVKNHCDERVRNHPDDLSATQAFGNFLTLVADVDAMKSVPAVLDGANVGFFGLCSWYGEAKRRAVAARGEEMSEMLSEEFVSSHLKKNGVPTDVSPNFAMIDAAVQTFAETHQGATPVVFLHERHVTDAAFLANDNRRFYDSWQQRGVRVVITPNHVNDDICWMYAAIRHECPVISNDQMRDHHAKLMALQAFIKWRATNRITFTARFEQAKPVGVRLFASPSALVWSSVVPSDDSSVRLRINPAGMHIPFCKHALLEDKGKLLPNAPMPAGHVLVPDSGAELMDFALANVDGWICAPLPAQYPPAPFA